MSLRLPLDAMEAGSQSLQSDDGKHMFTIELVAGPRGFEPLVSGSEGRHLIRTRLRAQREIEGT